MDKIVLAARLKHQNSSNDGNAKSSAASKWEKLKAFKNVAMEADSDKVVVGVRVRPLNKIELDEENKECFKKVGKQMIREKLFGPDIAGTSLQGKEYVYDHVFGPKNSTLDVYERVAKPLIGQAMEGFNSTVFAYGQTSSGKTHTLMGSESEPGITMHAINEVFQKIEETANTEFLVRISYLEIYNEEIKDLLDDGKKTKGRRLVIKDDPKKGPIVANLTEEIVDNPTKCKELIAKGEAARSYGSTAMNEQSSRSHVLFKMVIESRAIENNGANTSSFTKEWSKDRPPVKEAALNLVDLAGSERQKKTSASGQRLKEGTAINQSLLNLGQVISKLAEGNSKDHIPYRNSKLTRLLQMSLGGNAKTAMIAAISPAERNRDETTSTLRYASRAKQITNYARKNEIEDEESMLSQYKNEIESLKKELESAKASAPVDQATIDEHENTRNELAEMQKVVLVSTQIAASQRKMGNRDIANKIQNDIRDVGKGKRRAQSVYMSHKQFVPSLPDEDQVKLARQRRSIKSIVTTDISILEEGVEDQDLSAKSASDGQGEDADNDDDLVDDVYVDDYSAEKLKEAQTNIDRLTERLSALENDHQQLRQSEETLKQTAANLQKDAAHSATTIQKLRKDLDVANDSLDKSQQSHSKTQRQLQNTSSALEDKVVALNNTDSKNSELKTALNTLQVSFDDARRDSSRTIADLKRQLAESTNSANASLEAKSNEISRLASEKEELSVSLEQLADNHATYKKKCADLQTSLDVQEENSTRKIDKLTKDLATAKADCDDAVNAIATAKQQHSKQLQQLESELATNLSIIESERAKIKQISSEKNQLENDHDTLLRANKKLTKDNNNNKSRIDSINSEIETLTTNSRSTNRKLELSEEALTESDRKLNMLNEKTKSLETTLEAAELKNKTLADQIHAQTKENATITKQTDALKKELTKTSSDLSSSRNKTIELENSLTDATTKSDELESLNSKLKGDIDTLTEKAEQTSFYVQKSKNLESELSKVVADLSETRQKQIDMTTSNSTLELDIKRLNDTITNLNEEVLSHKTENEVLRETMLSIKQASTAKDETVEATNNQLKIMVNSKKLLEQELDTIRKSSLEVSKMKRISESECTKLKRLNDSLSIDNEELKNRIGRLETELETLQSEVGVGNEVAILRKQMSAMRNSMLDDGEHGGDEYSYDLDDMHVESPRKKRMNESKLLEAKREKEAYETIISKLRDELSVEADKRRKIVVDLSNAKKEAAVVAALESTIGSHLASIKRLEDEIAAKDVEIQRTKRGELNATAQSAEFERTVERKKDDNASLTLDIVELQNLVQVERIRADRVEQQLANSEKKCAQILAEKVRAETVSENALQESEIKSRALDNLREGEEETLKKLLSLQEEFEILRESHDKASAALDSLKLEKAAVENEQKLWKSVAEEAERELKKEDFENANMNDRFVKLESDLKLSESHKQEQKRIISNLQAEITALHENKNEMGNMVAGMELKQLRKELEQTVSDWAASEKKRQDREDRLVELKAGLDSEIEKNSLLLTQVKLLEDQLSVMKEEMGVYRQIDVYNSSVRASTSIIAKASSIRKSKEHRSHNTAQKTFSSPISLANDKMDSSFAHNLSRINLRDDVGWENEQPRSPENTSMIGNSLDDSGDSVEGDYSINDIEKAKKYLMERRSRR